MVVSAEAYRQAVADSPPYLGDDLDPFDVSLRLAAQGRTNWYVPVEFYLAPLENAPAPAGVHDFDAALLDRSWPKAVRP